jgi:hypothetical protein
MPNSQSKRCRYDERVGTTVGNGDGRRMGVWRGAEATEMELLKRMLYSSGLPQWQEQQCYCQPRERARLSRF